MRTATFFDIKERVLLFLKYIELLPKNSIIYRDTLKENSVIYVVIMNIKNTRYEVGYQKAVNFISLLH
ncbi:hypothetical protein GCM10011344_33440 [Dokdonia pacifica]|nr:hypothetical protein GCM10011344_33440 [Dokdonia pacifica]